MSLKSFVNNFKKKQPFLFWLIIVLVIVFSLAFVIIIPIVITILIVWRKRPSGLITTEEAERQRDVVFPPREADEERWQREREEREGEVVPDVRIAVVEEEEEEGVIAPVQAQQIPINKIRDNFIEAVSAKITRNNQFNQGKFIIEFRTPDDSSYGPTLIGLTKKYIDDHLTPYMQQYTHVRYLGNIVESIRLTDTTYTVKFEVDVRHT